MIQEYKFLSRVMDQIIARIKYSVKEANIDSHSLEWGKDRYCMKMDIDINLQGGEFCDSISVKVRRRLASTAAEDFISMLIEKIGANENVKLRPDEREEYSTESEHYCKPVTLLTMRSLSDSLCELKQSL